MALAALLVGLFTGLLGAGSAQAFDNYVFSGTLGGPAGGFAFGAETSTRIAVDGATGNVLGPDGGQVQVWGPGGEASVLLSGSNFGAGELSGTYGIAIDQSNGSVYVSDATHIARYTVAYPVPEEPTVPVYTLDPTFTSPSGGPDATAGEVGNFASALAVDPTTGDLLVADRGNNYVERFDSSGNFLSAFNGADSVGGAFGGLLDLAAGSDGLTYVIDSVGGTSRVDRFNAAGLSQGALPDVDGKLAHAQSIAVGQTTGDVFIVERTHPFSTLYVYHGGVRSAFAYPEEYPFIGSIPIGLAVDDAVGTSSGRVYGLMRATDFSGMTPAAVFDRQRQPDATLDPPSDVTPNSVHLSGTVDPLGVGPATFTFELSADGGTTWNPVADESTDAGESESVAHPVADATGLLESVEYRARLSATNANGTHTSAVQTFTTGTLPPGVSGERVTERETTSATLRGSVDPRGLLTSYHFDYGLTSAYGSRIPAGNEVTLGSGHGLRGVAQLLPGLAPNTTYHYRLVAENAAGETIGADQTFTTSAVGLPQRAYELVSPADKGGGAVSSGRQGFQMGSSGNTAVFSASSVLPGLGSGSAPLHVRYVAQRTQSGWTTKGVDPPQLASDILGVSFTLGVSDDGTKAIVMSKRKLADGAVEGDANTYLRDVATGEYVTMSTTPDPTDNGYWSHQVGLTTREFVAGTPSFDHILLFGSGVSFLPGVPNNALYEFADGQLRVASVAPDGAPLASGGIGEQDHDSNMISDDGSRVFFTSAGVLYVRMNGSTTDVVSASHRTVDAGTPRAGNFLAAAADGRNVFFLGKDLTDDSDPGLLSLYRYGVDDGELMLLTKVAVSAVTEYPVTPFGASVSGDTLYFVSVDDLTGDPNPSVKKLYVWRNGTLSRVAALDSEFDTLNSMGPSDWRVSPDGRYFAFTAGTRLTDYDNSIAQPPKVCNSLTSGDSGRSCREVYLYDADTKTIVCASCRPDGEPPTGHAGMTQVILQVGTHTFPRSVNDRGQVFFDSPDPLVARDTNGAQDVYEFDGEEARLISSGTGGKSQFEGASADGTSVFFTTQNRLVTADADADTDLYVARVGGGFSSQNVVPSAPCSGEGCRPPASNQPPPPPSGSEGTSGAGNASPRKKKRCGKVRHKQRVKGKTRCVKQHKANNNRRQGR